MDDKGNSKEQRIASNRETAIGLTTCFLSQRNKVRSITTPDLKAHSKNSMVPA